MLNGGVEQVFYKAIERASFLHHGSAQLGMIFGSAGKEIKINTGRCSPTHARGRILPETPACPGVELGREGSAVVGNPQREVQTISSHLPT
jgi:hypothetical protein